MAKDKFSKNNNNILNNIISFLDNAFDYIFLILSITTVVFSFVLLFNFFSEMNFAGFEISGLFEIGLTALITVKFYKVIKDYIGDHKIALANLAEIGIVAILSKLIFKIEAFTTEEILIRILLLVILIVFYYYAIYFEKKGNN